ncbi:MAG: hypothetical protein P4L84_28580 [Isosphaeraceae bacterium]|nr:hypothetical protein [Isosphaeraceae bacterium]
MHRSTTDRGRAALCGLLCSAIILAASGLAPDNQPAPTAAGLPDDIAQALRHNAAALSPLSISWETKFRTDLPVAEAVRIGQFPEKSSFFDPRTVKFSRQDGKFSYLRKMGGSRRGARFSHRYDGVNLYQGTGSEEDGFSTLIFVFGPEQVKKSSMFVYESEYFDRAGFKLYGTMETLQKPDEAMILYLLGRGAKLTSDNLTRVEGSYCRNIELTSEWGRHQFYLDPALNYALRKYVDLTADGRTKRVTTNREFVEFPAQKIWLPRESSSAWHTWSSMKGKVRDSPLVYEDIRADHLDKSPMPDKTFVMDMKRPTTIVADTRLPGAEKQKGGFIEYQVPADLEYLDGVIEAATKGKKFVPPLPDNRRTKVIIALNVVILSAGVVFLWNRAKR